MPKYNGQKELSYNEIVNIYEAVKSGMPSDRVAALAKRSPMSVCRIKNGFETVKRGEPIKDYITDGVYEAALKYFGRRLDNSEKTSKEEKDTFAVNRALIAIEAQLKALNEKQGETNRLLAELARVWGAVETR